MVGGNNLIKYLLASTLLSSSSSNSSGDFVVGSYQHFGHLSFIDAIHYLHRIDVTGNVLVKSIFHHFDVIVEHQKFEILTEFEPLKATQNLKDGAV